MFNFFGLRKDSKKSPSERETDGFVIVGETAEEKKQKSSPTNNVQLATNVIVLPSKQSSSAMQNKPTEAVPSMPAAPTSEEPQSVDGPPAVPELLGDIPFTLAPHILAMQGGLPHIPDFVLPQNINENLSNFSYDFSLENSVLCEL